MFDDLSNRPYHVIRTRLLAHLPVDSGDVPQLLGIDQGCGLDTWPYGREAVERLGVAVLASRDGGRALEIARREVVADGIAEHVVEGVGCFDVLCISADHDG